MYIYIYVLCFVVFDFLSVSVTSEVPDPASCCTHCAHTLPTVPMGAHDALPMARVGAYCTDISATDILQVADI